MAVRRVDDDGETATFEIEGNLVDLPIFADVDAGAQNRGIERAADARLESTVHRCEPERLFRHHAGCIDSGHELHVGLSQRPCLVRTQDVDAPESSGWLAGA